MFGIVTKNSVHNKNKKAALVSVKLCVRDKNYWKVFLCESKDINSEKWLQKEHV